MVETVELKCKICGRPLVGEEWIDDDDYGDVHVRCLERKLDAMALWTR